jgi:hypothetical protein
MLTGQHHLAHELVGALAGPRMWSSSRTSSAAIVSALIRPRPATTQTRAMAKRRRSQSTTGIKVVTSAALPGHISEHTGRPSPSERSVDR